MKVGDLEKFVHDRNRIVQMWRAEHKGFKIGQGIFQISDYDVKNILGLESTCKCFPMMHFKYVSLVGASIFLDRC